MDRKQRLNRANALVKARMDLVAQAIDAQARVEELHAQLPAAQDAAAAAYRAALDGGWTPAELAEVGLTAPAGTRARRRKATTAAAAPVAQPVADDPADVDEPWSPTGT